MIDYTLLPHLNALLNAISALLAGTGFASIRKREIRRHRACMAGAVIVSALFLASYLTYHLQQGTVRLQKTGWIRPVYFTILISHSVLAIAVVPLVLVSLRQALAQRFARHRAIARWTLPIWIYVSVTGVLIYLILYHY